MNNTKTSNTKYRVIGLSVFIFLLMGINSICTQFVAERFGYNPSLGNPLFAHVYGPFSWFGWYQKFFNYAPAAFGHAFLIFIIGTVIALAVFRIYIGLITRSSRKNEGSHGTAAFATYEQIKETGLINEDNGSGVYCGGYFNETTGRTHYLRHNGTEHIAVIAPPRSGKGVVVVIPTLLSWPESVFVLDIKGENYAMTAGWRQKQANNIVLRFDPAEPGKSCSWNPLGEIRFGTRYQVSDAQNIALMVIDSDGKGIQGDHFRSAAFELLVGLILHALYKSESLGREACIQDCAHMLTSVGEFAAPDKQSEDDADPRANGKQSKDDVDPKALAGLFFEMSNVSLTDTVTNREAQLVIRGVGIRMKSTPARELGSIISTANNALSLYRDPIVGENTSRSDFKISDLMDIDRPVSLYFITTPRNTDRMKPLARLLLTQIVLGLADQMQFDAGRSRTVHKNRLLMMLDEFPSLGRLDVFETALAFLSGYGIKAYIIIQDVQQLYKTYTNNETIISNCHIRIAHAPNKLETAEWLSKMTGQTTVIKEQISTSGKRFGMVLGQVSRSFQESQRYLMTADEIMRLPGPVKNEKGDMLVPGEMLIFSAGHPVIRGRQTPYFLDPTFDKRSKIPPPTESNVVRKTKPLFYMAG